MDWPYQAASRLTLKNSADELGPLGLQLEKSVVGHYIVNVFVEHLKVASYYMQVQYFDPLAAAEVVHQVDVGSLRLMRYLKMADSNIHMVAADQRIAEAAVKRSMPAVEVAEVAAVVAAVGIVAAAVGIVVGIVGIVEVAELAEVVGIAGIVDIVGSVEIVAIAVAVEAVAVEEAVAMIVEVAATGEVAVALDNRFEEVAANLALEADIPGMSHPREDIALKCLDDFDQICQPLHPILPLLRHRSHQSYSSCLSYLYFCY